MGWLVSLGFTIVIEIMQIGDPGSSQTKSRRRGGEGANPKSEVWRRQRQPLRQGYSVQRDVELVAMAPELLFLRYPIGLA